VVLNLPLRGTSLASRLSWQVNCPVTSYGDHLVLGQGAVEGTRCGSPNVPSIDACLPSDAVCEAARPSQRLARAVLSDEAGTPRSPR
jgi:hypothetical protein